MHFLKIIRVTIALVVITMISVYFIDFTGRIPQSWSVLPRFQWIPALLSVTPVLSFLFVLSLLFGRFFCSAICPLGIFQDLMIRISRKFPHRKKVKYEYAKPHTLIRYGVLGITLFSFFAGSTGLLLLLDPYSNFGRLMASLSRPLAIIANNLVVKLCVLFGFYPQSLYPAEITGLTILSVGSGILILVVIALFTWHHGRLYCNTVCPVGTFLGLLARVSLFRIKLDKVQCTGCGICGTICKSKCIDSKNQEVDVSRCVSCFNCLKVCRKGAIKYKFIIPSSLKRTSPAYLCHSRRKAIFFTGSLVGSFLTRRSIASTLQKDADPAASRQVVLPPGAEFLDKFNKQCTACQLCITKCPSHVLQPATLQYGIEGILQPHMVYKDGYCNYNCTICADVCPTNALSPLTLKEKQLTQIGVAQFRSDLCIVPTRHTDCGACAEHCPTQAVKMIPYKDGLTIPSLDPSICIGCGGCEFICPVRPYQAIYIEGNEFHHRALAPQTGEKSKQKVDDFGF